MDIKFNKQKILTLSFAKQVLGRDIHVDDFKGIHIEMDKWVAQCVTGTGCPILNLNNQQLSTFINKLADLSIALYRYQTKVQKGGGHES